MNISDCHVHIEHGLKNYDLTVDFQNVIFNTIESYISNKKHVASSDSISLIFDYQNNFEFVLDQSSFINAYKVHTRFQRITAADYEELIEKLKLADDNKPIILDAFYYGKELDSQPDLRGFIQIIESFPSRQFVIAHCGGYKVLEYFFHLREFENVYYDLSLSLQYLSDTSIINNLIKLIKFTPKEKVMFGSDYHFASPSFQFDILIQIADQLKLNAEERRMIFHDNALRMFKPEA